MGLNTEWGKKVNQDGHEGPGVPHLSLPDCDSMICPSDLILD